MILTTVTSVLALAVLGFVVFRANIDYGRD
ncbi:hypothetical protein BH11ACT3_BH11ACT3_21310 [soil metagenome]